MKFTWEDGLASPVGSFGSETEDISKWLKLGGAGPFFFVSKDRDPFEMAGLR